MKNRYVSGVISGLVVAALAVGGYVFWHNHKPAKVSYGAASINVDGTSSQTDAGNSGGLSVNSASSAQNLGQLGGSQGSSGGAAQGQSGSGSSSSSSSGGGIDPSTFSQYDKYKSSTNALFGDAQVGTGATLGANQKATVYYKGWLTNGTLFDESRPGSDGKLQPFMFTLGAHQVIPGWEEGVAGMKVGGVRLIIVPPSVGYGAQGQGSIPPNSVLVFEVQLLSVQ